MLCRCTGIRTCLPLAQCGMNSITSLLIKVCFFLSRFFVTNLSSFFWLIRMALTACKLLKLSLLLCIFFVISLSVFKLFWPFFLPQTYLQASYHELPVARSKSYSNRVCKFQSAHRLPSLSLRENIKWDAWLSFQVYIQNAGQIILL